MDWFLLALVFVVLLRKSCEIVTVQGRSMAPTLFPGEKVIVCRILSPRRGQIVICDLTKANQRIAPQEQFFVKRLIGLAGDQISFHESELDEYSKFSQFTHQSTDGYYWVTVPKAHYFVRADGNGVDSRHWGALPIHSLHGIVISTIAHHK